MEEIRLPPGFEGAAVVGSSETESDNSREVVPVVGLGLPPSGIGGVGLHPWAQSPALLRRCSSVLHLPTEDEREGDSEEEGFASDVSLPFL